MYPLREDHTVWPITSGEPFPDFLPNHWNLVVVVQPRSATTINGIGSPLMPCNLCDMIPAPIFTYHPRVFGLVASVGSHHAAKATQVLDMNVSVRFLRNITSDDRIGLRQHQFNAFFVLFSFQSRFIPISQEGFIRHRQTGIIIDE